MKNTLCKKNGSKRQDYRSTETPKSDYVIYGWPLDIDDRVIMIWADLKIWAERQQRMSGLSECQDYDSPGRKWKLRSSSQVLQHWLPWIFCFRIIFRMINYHHTTCQLFIWRLLFKDKIISKFQPIRWLQLSGLTIPKSIEIRHHQRFEIMEFCGRFIRICCTDFTCCDWWGRSHRWWLSQAGSTHSWKPIWRGWEGWPPLTSRPLAQSRRPPWGKTSLPAPPSSQP